MTHTAQGLNSKTPLFLSFQIEFSEDCVFNESMELHHFNTYSSSHHSNARHTLYLALNRHGAPRRVQISPSRPLGNLATYTKSLTQTVDQGRAEALIIKNFGPTYVKHGLKQLCDAGKTLRPLTDAQMRARPKCAQQPPTVGGGASKVKKTEKNITKKKKRRKCRDDEPEGENCAKSIAQSPPEALKRRENKNHKTCSNEEDCGNQVVESNKKQQRVPQQKRLNRTPPPAAKTKSNNQQIFAIKKLKSKGKSATTTTTSTTSTTPKAITDAAEPDELMMDESSDEYDDNLGHVVQFVDDVDDEFQL